MKHVRCRCLSWSRAFRRSPWSFLKHNRVNLGWFVFRPAGVEGFLVRRTFYRSLRRLTHLESKMSQTSSLVQWKCRAQVPRSDLDHLQQLLRSTVGATKWKVAILSVVGLSSWLIAIVLSTLGLLLNYIISTRIYEMGKTRVGVILREGMGSKSSTANQSADLKALHDKYTVFCKNIRSLALALQHHLGSLQQMEKTRSMVSDKAVEILSF